MVKKTKSTCFVATICLFFVLLCSCGIDQALHNGIEIFEHRDDIIDITSDFEHNGSLYHFFKRQGDNRYYQFYDCKNEKHSGEVVGHYVTMYGALGDISRTCEADFGDSVIKISGSAALPSFYTKEGFSFPDYRLLSIKSIYLSEHRHFDVAYENEKEIDSVTKCVANYAETENIVLTDFLDSDNCIQYEGHIREQENLRFAFDMAFTLKDFSTFYCGFYSMYEYEDSLYIEIDDTKTLYKIKDEYLNLFYIA